MEDADVSSRMARSSGLRMKHILTSPLFHINLLLLGTLILIGVVHQHAHNNIERDVHGYCYNLERTK